MYYIQVKIEKEYFKLINYLITEIYPKVKFQKDQNYNLDKKINIKSQDF